MTREDETMSAVELLTTAGLITDPTDVVDEYPLTPLQEGMTFLSMDATSDGAHVFQQVLGGHTPDGPMRPEWVAQALRGLATLHPVLRTAFVVDGLPEPRQVVLRDRAIGFNVVDLASNRPFSEGAPGQSLRAGRGCRTCRRAPDSAAAESTTNRATGFA